MPTDGFAVNPENSLPRLVGSIQNYMRHIEDVAAEIHHVRAQINVGPWTGIGYVEAGAAEDAAAAEDELNRIVSRLVGIEHDLIDRLALIFHLADNPPGTLYWVTDDGHLFKEYANGRVFLEKNSCEWIEDTGPFLRAAPGDPNYRGPKSTSQLCGWTVFPLVLPIICQIPAGEKPPNVPDPPDHIEP